MDVLLELGEGDLDAVADLRDRDALAGAAGGDQDRGEGHQAGEALGADGRLLAAEILVSERIAWQVERNFGRFGEIEKGDGDVVFTTPYSSSRQLISFVFSLGEHARIAGPPELVDETKERIALIVERHDGKPSLAEAEDEGDQLARGGVGGG
ncbi:MAG: WYL domain-containing protein, partial [Solirubrobacterales bacterium]